LKLGRPKKGEKRAKPWEAAGMSKASWYRLTPQEMAIWHRKLHDARAEDRRRQKEGKL